LENAVPDLDGIFISGLLVHVIERKKDMRKPEQNEPIKLNKTHYMFIPKRLEIAERPEMSRFPANVLFLSFRNTDGRLQAGSALYEPDFDTYHSEQGLCSMRYHNVYGGDCYLAVTYHERNGQYRGEKFVNGKRVSVTVSTDNWRSFFTHFTMLGLVDGEHCKFEYVEEVLAGGGRQQLKKDSARD
jgi:hypothetical protein